MWPVYFINLDRSTDRLAHMRGQEQILGAGRFRRVAALDGLRTIHDETEPRVAACLASHLRAIATARVEARAEAALVLEDDADLRILAGRLDELRALVERLPRDWEILQLFTLNLVLADQREDFQRWNHFNYGAVGYLIHRRGMERLRGMTSADIVRDHNFHADNALYRACITYTVTRPFLNTIARDSTIHPDDVERCHAPTRDWINAWYDASQCHAPS